MQPIINITTQHVAKHSPTPSHIKDSSQSSRLSTPVKQRRPSPLSELATPKNAPKPKPNIKRTQPFMSQIKHAVASIDLNALGNEAVS